MMWFLVVRMLSDVCVTSDRHIQASHFSRVSISDSQFPILDSLFRFHGLTFHIQSSHFSRVSSSDSQFPILDSLFRFHDSNIVGVNPQTENFNHIQASHNYRFTILDFLILISDSRSYDSRFKHCRSKVPSQVSSIK